MLKIGVIGGGDPGNSIGSIIRNHTTCIYAGNYVSDAVLAKQISEGQGVPVFTSYEAFLAECDAIIVDSISDVSPEQITTALKGSMHILLEKPMEWEDSELEYLFKLADEANSLLKFRETFLHHPVIKGAEPFIHNPAFIDYQIGISSESPSEILPEKILGSFLQCLDAITHLNPGRVSKYNTVFSPDLFGVPGVIHGRIEYDNGCVANITCNGFAEQEKSVCYIFQENRHAILNFQTRRLTIKDRKQEDEKPRSFSVPLKSEDPIIGEILHFTESCLNNSYHLSSPDRYLQSFLLARRMIENLPIHEFQT